MESYLRKCSPTIIAFDNCNNKNSFQFCINIKIQLSTMKIEK